MSPLPRTQSAALTEARALIDKYAPNVPFNKKDLARLSELTQTPLRKAILRLNPLYPAASRYVRAVFDETGVEQDWSWPKAIKRTYSRDPLAAREKQIRKKVLSALREAIENDLRCFLHSQKKVCAHCESVENLTVDHQNPTFETIVNTFLKSHPIESIVLLETRGHSGLLADADLIAEWLAYHRALATLQILCRRCNSAKGART